MKQQRTLTCIVCPMGCTLNVSLEKGRVTEVTGNTCPRGKHYATDECTAPKRTVTSTMRCTNGDVVSVKTDSPIPKELVFKCMENINSLKIDLPISAGDVIIENVLNTNSNIVATQNKKTL